MVITDPASDLSTHRGRDVSDRSVYLSVVYALCWLIVAPPAIAMTASNGPRAALIVSSVASTALGLTIFFNHGGSHVTATGVYGLSSAVFVGFAGLFVANDHNYLVDGYTVAAAVSSYVTNVLLYYIFLRRTSHRAPMQPRQTLGAAPLKVILRGIKIGSVLLFLALLIATLDVRLYPVSSSFAYTGALLVGGSLMFYNTSGQRGFYAPLLIPLTFVPIAIYVVTFFNGLGRLNVATLLLALGLMAQPSEGKRRLKAALVVGTVLCLVIFAAVRSRQEAPGMSSEARSKGRGISSAVSPLATYAELLRRDNDGLDIGAGYGSTFVAATVFWIPRQVWSSKPIGFGALLTAKLSPELQQSEVSLAALAQGEWFYNFGPPGLLLMVVALGVLLPMFDRGLASVRRSGVRSIDDLLRLVLRLIVVVGLADYVWVGSFTFSARAGPRLAVLGLVAVLLRGLASVRREDRRRGLARGREEPGNAVPAIALD